MEASSAVVRRPVIPGPTVDRLPKYHRSLLELDARGIEVVSSAELAAAVGVNAATLRRDLSRLGSIGTRGTGYDVALLLHRVESALALDRQWRVAIVGVGNLGRALARSRGFGSGGFRVVALLDVNSKVVGTSLYGIKVAHVDQLTEVVRDAQATIGVITTPASSAQNVASAFVDAGVVAILNFAPAVISLPGDVALRHVDLGAELQVLSYYGAHLLSRTAGGKGGERTDAPGAPEHEA